MSVLTSVNIKKRTYRNRIKEREYELINQDKIRESRKKWNKENKEYRYKYNKEYRANHPNINRDYRKNNPEKVKEYKRKSHLNLRLRLFEVLGGFKCIKCNIIDIRVLVFDHKNGGGRKDQLKFKNNQNMYRYYINHPKEARELLQILCHNCNIIKKCEEKENPNIVRLKPLFSLLPIQLPPID